MVDSTKVTMEFRQFWEAAKVAKVGFAIEVRPGEMLGQMRYAGGSSEDDLVVCPVNPTTYELDPKTELGEQFIRTFVQSGEI
jgi:hypothetical protein